jgi:MFS family permease
MQSKTQLLTGIPAIEAPASGPIIATGTVHRWIEPWYLAYAILGALASGFAIILIPLVVTRSGGPALEIGAAVAAQNLGLLAAPVWRPLADRTQAYRAIFFLGFLLLGIGFLVFTLTGGIGIWMGAAFLIGFGTGTTNTVASRFVIEFTPQSQWHQRISWLQTFNACGSVLGMAAAGVLDLPAGLFLSAALAMLGMIIGRDELPVPGKGFHIAPEPKGRQLANLLRRGGPMAAAIHQHRWRPMDFARLAFAITSPFGRFLVGWFAFSVGVSAFGSLYAVLMQRSFGMPTSAAATSMALATALSLPLYNWAGRLEERWGATVVLRIGYLGRLLAFAGLAALAYVQPGLVLWGAAVLFALFQGIWPLLSVASNEMVTSHSPFGEGPSIGLFNAVAAVASGLGAIAGGAIADKFGYTAVPVFAAIALLLALTTVRQPESDAELGQGSSERPPVR